MYRSVHRYLKTIIFFSLTRNDNTHRHNLFFIYEALLPIHFVGLIKKQYNQYENRRLLKPCLAFLSTSKPII